MNCESCRRTAVGYQRRKYTHAEIDGIAAYSPDLDRCYFLPVDLVASHRELSLRIEPAKNNQLLGLNRADLFEFTAIDWPVEKQPGAIAQLEERGHGMAEVVGSSPTSSTPPTQVPGTVGAEDLRNRLGTFLHRAHLGQDFVVTRRGRPYARLTPP